MTTNATERLAEAQERAWLGEVAGLEDSLKHLRQRRTEAEQQLKAAAWPPAPCGAARPGEDGRSLQVGVGSGLGEPAVSSAS
jgi:hypothetical protein